MKKLLLLLAGSLGLFAGTAHAQFNYDFTNLNGQTYTSITNDPAAIRLTDTVAYDDAIYGTILPFTMQIDRRSMDTMWLLTENLFFNALIDAEFVSGFMFTDADLADKGTFDSTNSKSPVSVLVTGTAPNRIYKVEYANVGFYDEFYTYSSADDSVNIQIWLYEGSNIVELRYGPSSVTHFNDYFPEGSMQAGLLHDLDIMNGTSGTFYYLSGNPASPTIDSGDVNSPPAVANFLTGWPANGTVYRWAPKPLGVGTVTGNVSLNVFPTATRETLNVTYGDAGTASYVMISAQGAIAQKGTLRNGSNKLDVSTLAPGNYVLHARNAGGNGTFRFTKL